jgi:predicted nucleotidyltransferase
MIDLRAKDRQIIEQIATSIFEAKTEIWAYGSRVAGTNHAASDLDLVVKPAEDSELDLEKLAEFIEALHDSTIPILIQVFSWANIPEPFRENILRRHEVLLVVGADEGSQGCR